MRKIIVGNWKMNGDAAGARALAKALVRHAPPPRVVVCPPFVLVAQVKHWLGQAKVAVGGQDCHSGEAGAFTGDTSAAMLKDAGCRYVIVGHSERRQHHGETNATVRAKALAAMRAGLIPIICIGETTRGKTLALAQAQVALQLRESLPKEAANHDFLLAYEPVWAIGSGKMPTLADIRHMHEAIISLASQRTKLASQRICVLYGGSVKPDNARDILSLKEVGGVLVGGASLKAKEFGKIIESGV